MSSSHPNPVESSEEIKWVKFWETPGSLSAEVIAGRLKSEGIPAWVWQQGAGSAMGLTYGPMGRGHVMVPEEQLDEARRIMATDLTFEAEEEGDWPYPEPDVSGDNSEDGKLSNAVLALIALAVSPIGVATVFIVAKLFGSKEKIEPTCPDCETVVDLEEDEKEQGWFVCSECGRTVLIK
jgi:hypothetical protein